MTSHDCDLFVIGAGSGGVRAARLAAERGLKTIIAEQDRLGGTCVNRGCVPKKLMVYAAEYGERDLMADFGWPGGEGSPFDWPVFKKNKDVFIAKLNTSYENRLRQAGVRIIPARAMVTGPQHVQADGRLYHSRHILLATGGSPRRANIAGADLTLTSDDMFHLPSWPRRILIVGGGYIAVEFAGICHRLGTQTTLIHRRETVLRGFDHELGSVLCDTMHRRGVALRLGRQIICVERVDDGLRAVLDDDTTLIADQILYAIGRSPNSADLGLEEAGVRLGNRGEVIVDDGFRSSVPSIYAIGDLIGRVALTPVAITEAAVLVNRLCGKDMAMDYTHIPSAVFSDPNLAGVGLTEKDARARYPRVQIRRSLFTPLRNALADNPDQTVLVKVISNEDDQKILGMHMIGADAAEIIQGMAVALRAGVDTPTLAGTVGIHPTIAEEFVSL